jgi:cbb3-type cytochrome oxidase subunit 1
MMHSKSCQVSWVLGLQYIPSKSMRTPMYCYKLTCVSLWSFMYLQIPSRALLVEM